jgi:hypothetical protein
LRTVSDSALDGWWQPLDKVLANVTGEDRKIGDFVVYKNFPREVLEMSQAEYWIKQVLMYAGLPNDCFTATEAPREPMLETLKLPVLQPADSHTLRQIANSLLAQPARWTDEQLESILWIAESGLPIDPTAIPFKENLVQLLAWWMMDIRMFLAWQFHRLTQ